MFGFNDLMYIAGAIIGGFIIVGIFAFKFKLIKWGWGDAPASHGLNLEVLSTIQKRVLERLDVIEDRQEKLREDTLPNFYVRRDDMEDLKTSIKEISGKLDVFIESCRKGECAAGRK